MTIHLERKIAHEGVKYPYQRMSYDIVTDENNKLSIYELNRILNEFKNRSDGEFNYFITGDTAINESGELVFGETLYGENFFQSLK